MAAAKQQQQRKLVAYVHVHDEKGVSHAFGPGDDLPAWARKQITNKAAWDADEAPTEGNEEADPDESE